MDRRKAVVALLITAIVVVMGGVVLSAYSTSSQAVNNGGMQVWLGGNGFVGCVNGRMAVEKPRGWMYGRGVVIDVSQEYREKVINIIQNDPDVKNLLDNGYSVKCIKPVIKTAVKGDGTLVTKATTAIVTLWKNTTARATVWVDLEQGKVTKIAILTLTVIEKS